MPRAGQVRIGPGERLSDRVALGVLTATFPRSLVDEVIEATGRREQRNRLLPAHVSLSALRISDMRAISRAHFSLPAGV